MFSAFRVITYFCDLLRIFQKFKIKIEDPPRRKDMVFTGGAVLAEVMKNRDEFWISRNEYEEKGISILSKLGKRLSH